MAYVNKGSQFYMPPTCSSTSRMSRHAFDPQPHCIIFSPIEDRRLSWSGWLVTCRGSMPAQRWSPISVPTDW